MYKLTYESEDDLDDTKKSASPTVPQFEKQDHPAKMQEKEERSESLDSVVASSYAANDYKANQQNKMKKKFYELFRSQENNKKGKECCFSKGINTYSILAVVIALLFAVIALFALYSAASMKNKMLNDRLSVIEETVLGGSFVLQAPPPPDMPEKINVPQAADYTEYDQVNSRIDDLRERFENIETTVRGQIQSIKSLAGRLIETDRRLSQNLEELEEQIKAANGMASLSLDVSSEDKKEMMKMDAKSVVFSASHVTMPSDSNGDEIYKIGPSSSLKYDIKIDNHDSFSTERGEFVAPADGAYVFHVSFCSMQGFGNFPKVGLVKNDDVFKTSNPFLPTDESSLVENLPVSEIDFMFARNSFSAVIPLNSGDRVRMDVLSGSIVELHGKEDSCTTFAGYHV